MKKIIELEVTKRTAQETAKGMNYILTAKSPKTSKGSTSEITLTIHSEKPESLETFPLHHQFTIQINNPQKNMKDFVETETTKKEEELEPTTT